MFDCIEVVEGENIPADFRPGGFSLARERV
jgi:hypothetical protein